MFYCNSSQWVTAPGADVKMWTKQVYSDSHLTSWPLCFTGRRASFNFTRPVANVLMLVRGGSKIGKKHEKEVIHKTNRV